MNRLLYRTEAKQYSAYIIIGDIVSSKSFPKDLLCQRIESLFSKLGDSFVNWEFNNKTKISTYPLGDGFVSVIIFVDEEDEGVIKPRYTRSILDLCYDIILLFSQNEYIQLRIGAHSGKVDCYNFKYTNGYHEKNNEFDYYIGDSIADCNRLVNFGDANHLIISEKFKEDWNYKKGCRNYNFQKHEFPDKKNEFYKFYTVIDNEKKLNSTQPTLKNPKPLIEDEDKEAFTKRIETCKLFYSTSVTDAKSWLNDQALLTVLIQQAVTSKDKDFKRLFIWRSEIQKSQRDYQICLSSHHKIAGVEFLKKNKTEADEILNKIKLNSKKLPSEFINNGIGEAWICCEKNCEENFITCNGCNSLEGGYGIWQKETESYEVKKVEYNDEEIVGFKELFINLFN